MCLNISGLALKNIIPLFVFYFQDMWSFMGTTMWQPVLRNRNLFGTQSELPGHKAFFTGRAK